MPNPNSPGTPNSSGQTPGRSGNIPGTERSGIVFYEYVNIERKIAGTWTVMSSNIPATFEPVSLHRRSELQNWTHKPLLGVWLMPTASAQDGDRFVRSDGSHWYVRGAPISGPGATHLAALTERASEDGLFAALSSAEF